MEKKKKTVHMAIIPSIETFIIISLYTLRVNIVLVRSMIMSAGNFIIVDIFPSLNLSWPNSILQLLHGITCTRMKRKYPENLRCHFQRPVLIAMTFDRKRYCDFYLDNVALYWDGMSLGICSFSHEWLAQFTQRE